MPGAMDARAYAVTRHLARAQLECVLLRHFAASIELKLARASTS